jgi:O-antigen/teichoic acid export membrane protein
MVKNVVLVYVYFVLRHAFPLAILLLLANGFAQYEVAVILAAQSAAMVAGPLIEYGFAVGGVREIALEHTVEGRTRIVSAIGTAQALLAVPALILLLALVFASPLLASHTILIAIGIVYALGFGATPAWYFQGTDRVRIAIVNEVIGLTCSVSLLALTAWQGGGPIVATAALASGQAIAALLGWRVVLAECPASFDIPAARNQLRDCTALFTVRMSLATYSTGATWLASLLTTAPETARFGMAIRLIGALSMVFAPLAQVMLPHVVKLYASDRGDSMPFLKKMFALFLVVGFALAIGVILTAEPIAHYILRDDAIASPLAILAAFLPLTAASQFIISYVLVPLRADRALASATAIGALAMLLLALWLAPLYQADGMAASRTLGEVLLLTLYATFAAVAARRVSVPAAPADVRTRA